MLNRAILLTCFAAVLVFSLPAQNVHAQIDYRDRLSNRGALTTARSRIAKLANTNVRSRPTMSPYLRLSNSPSRGTNYRGVRQTVENRRNMLAPERPTMARPVTSVGTGNRRPLQRRAATMSPPADQATGQAPAFRTGNPTSFMNHGHFYPF